MSWDLHLREYEEYLISRDKSQCTIIKYTSSVRQMLEYIDKRPEDITQEDLDKYKIHMKRLYDDNSLSPYVSAINHFFAMKGITIKLKAPPRKRKNVIPLTERETKRMFAVSERDPMAYAILTTLYYSQLRNSELCNLNISDIDFERSRIRVNNGKGGNSAEINLHPTALNAIMRYLEKGRVQPKDCSDILFVSNAGNRMARTPLHKLVKKYAVKAGISKRVYPHLFRHSCISHMADNGATLPEIQRQSRHKNIETLMNYVHPNEKKARTAYLKTVVNIDETAMEQKQPEKQGDQSEFESNMKLKADLTVALCSGKISEETYLKALEALRID